MGRSIIREQASAKIKLTLYDTYFEVYCVLLMHIYETESHLKKLIFDDIPPVTNEIEKLQIGEQEKSQIRKDHLMLWRQMLAEVENSELRSPHENNMMETVVGPALVRSRMGQSIVQEQETVKSNYCIIIHCILRPDSLLNANERRSNPHGGARMELSLMAPQCTIYAVVVEQ